MMKLIQACAILFRFDFFQVLLSIWGDDAKVTELFDRQQTTRQDALVGNIESRNRTQGD